MLRGNNTFNICNSSSNDPKHTPYPIKHNAHYPPSICRLRSSPRPILTCNSAKYLWNWLRTKPKSSTMLKIIVPTTILIPLIWLSKRNIIWINTTIYSLIISLLSLPLLNQFNDNSLNLSLTFFSDSLSTPLLILTTWLLPLILIASQHHLTKESLNRKKLSLY